MQNNPLNSGSARPKHIVSKVHFARPSDVIYNSRDFTNLILDVRREALHTMRPTPYSISAIEQPTFNQLSNML